MADIGCDHGYLSIALVQSRKAQRVIAMDINKGPVEAATEHVKLYGLEDSILIRRSDGLDKLSDGEAEVIVICGMGGALMQRIMLKHIDMCQTAKCLVVEPQSEIADFRRFLCAESFVIEEESMCVEENKYYPIMRISYKPDDSSLKLDDAQLKYGPCLIHNKPRGLMAWINKDEAEYLRIKSELEQRIESMDETQSNPIRLRIQELEHDLETIRRAREAMGR